LNHDDTAPTFDLNQDGNIDHDEWHEFKAVHGLKEVTPQVAEAVKGAIQEQ